MSKVNFYSKQQITEIKQVIKNPENWKDDITNLAKKWGRTFNGVYFKYHTLKTTKKSSGKAKSGLKVWNKGTPKATFSSREIKIPIKSVTLRDNHLIVTY